MLMFAPDKSNRALTAESVKRALLEMEEEDDERKAFPAGRQPPRRAV
jgi:hypothetical protein